MNEPKLLRKETITDKLIMKQKKYLIIAIMCVVTLLISSSYALLTNFDKTDEVITFQTGNLNMTVNNTAGTINLNGNLPENDTDGLKNAIPITLTLTNTGTINIGAYDVKLVSDKNKTSTLNEDYIKYAVSEDGTNYSNPNSLTSNDNIIFSGFDLEVDASKTIYLKVWIDEFAGNKALDKEYYGSIKIDLYQKKEEPPVYLLDTFKEELLTRTNSYTLEDDTYYISGAKDDNNPETRDDIDFNYVWYSGKLWRITSINPDGTMKMITNKAITMIRYGSDSIFYTNESTNSFVYQWLNQDFLDTLYNYEDIIKTDYKWNVSVVENINTKLPETTMVLAKVGLINSYEYYKSYEKLGNDSYETGYLSLKHFCWLLNGWDSSSSESIWFTRKDGEAYQGTYFGFSGVRPVINLKSTIELREGTGTMTDPYRLKLDKEEAVANTTLLNTRSSGEYVNFDGELYRIVGIENGTTKLNNVDFIRDENGEFMKNRLTKRNSTYGNGDYDGYWDYYLNNTWYNEISSSYKKMLEQGTYYLGILGGSDLEFLNYKYTICATVSNVISTKDCPKTTSIWSGYVGLPRYGEMFATQDAEVENMLLITPSDNVNGPWVIDSNNSFYPESSLEHGARPSINLKSTVVITGGKGTEGDPFVLGLPS